MGKGGEERKGERGEGERERGEGEVYLGLFSMMKHELQGARKLEDPYTIETAISITQGTVVTLSRHT